MIFRFFSNFEKKDVKKSKIEIDTRSIVLYLHKKGLSAKEIHNDIIQTLGPNIIKYSTVTKYLRNQSFPLKKITIENDQNFRDEEENQILVKNALKNFPFASVREIAKITQIPKSTVYNTLTIQLHYVLKHLRWVPHSLNSSQLSQRVSKSKELLQLLRQSKKNNYKFFYTGDESWFYLNTDYEQQWLPSGEILPNRMNKILNRKNTCSQFFGIPMASF